MVVNYRKEITTGIRFQFSGFLFIDKSDAKDNGSETAANDEAANEDSKEWADIVKDELGDDDAAIENNQEDEDEDSRAGNER